MIENVSECIIGGGMVFALYHLWAMWPMRASMWHIRVSHRRWVSWASSFEKALSRIISNDTCVNIVPQPMYQRLDYALAVQNVCRKWFSMDTRDFDARKNSNGWLFGMSQWNDRHVGLIPMNVSWASQNGQVHGMTSWCMGHVVGESRWRWDTTLLCCRWSNTCKSNNIVNILYYILKKKKFLPLVSSVSAF